MDWLVESRKTSQKIAYELNVKDQWKSVTKAKRWIAYKRTNSMSSEVSYIQSATNSSLSLKHSTNVEEWTDARLETGKSEIIKDPICQAKEFKLYSEGYVESQKDVKQVISAFENEYFGNNIGKYPRRKRLCTGSPIQLQS